jgi:hypothetical protein
VPHKKKEKKRKKKKRKKKKKRVRLDAVHVVIAPLSSVNS